MVQMALSTVVIISLIALIIGLVVGVSISRPMVR